MVAADVVGELRAIVCFYEHHGASYYFQLTRGDLGLGPAILVMPSWSYRLGPAVLWSCRLEAGAWPGSGP